ncbi:tetraspanin-1-like [Ambystoma mexicanum]|uniref:tetraspanin-1-like n=1 Tax=Ambystoma mexicanum TaxID=8296 RepID=UPI0037E6FE91
MADTTRLHNVYACLKYVMFYFNSIIFVAGLFLLILGTWTKYSADSVLKITGTYAAHFVNVGYFCIAVGCFLAILGVIGCCGALKENRCLLISFFIVMMIIFIAELSAAVVALAFSEVAESILKDKAMASLKEQYVSVNKNNMASEGWNTFMEKFKCCGFVNYTDFSNSNFHSETGLAYPKICCIKPESEACDGHNVTSAVIYQKGCFVLMLNTFQSQSTIIGVSAATVTILELGASLVALVLFVKLG